MISVVVPTNRVGGLDVLLDSLAAQTFRDFELILVDNIWRHRSRLVHDRIQSLPFRVKHIEPRENPFPRVAYCRTMNTGIAHARGETLVFLCDYSWLSPDCLATHAAVQKATPGPVHLDYDYCELPPPRAGFPGYHQDGRDGSDPGYVAAINATTDRYVADLQAGKLDPFMWSLFAEPLDSPMGLAVNHRHRPCKTREAGDFNWCSFKNESFPTELFLEMNGLNEQLDASHCYQDQEFSYRLRGRGIEWINGPAETGMVTVVNPRPVLNVKRLEKPIAWNRDVAAAGMGTVNPEWSLRVWREKVLSR